MKKQLARMTMVREAVKKTGKRCRYPFRYKKVLKSVQTVQNTTEADFGRAGYIQFNVGDETRISMDPEHKGTKRKNCCNLSWFI